MKRLNWQLFLVIFLLGLSAFIYLLQIELFHKLEDTAFYFFQDLAFVPIQVLLVTLIINQMLAVREKKATLKKLNMIIGVFYNEIGTPLLKYFYRLEPRARRSRKISGCKNTGPNSNLPDPVSFLKDINTRWKSGWTCSKKYVLF